MPLSDDWAKSSHSEPNGGNCVQARNPENGTVQVRDSKNPANPALAFTRAQWQAFTQSVKNDHVNA